MSQRNPLNDRYNTDEKLGQTRKSAASMKPKSKAASSVRLEPTTESKKEKKQERKARERAERAKQAELDRKYYNPPTAEFKRTKRLWWGLLIAAVVFTALSWLVQSHVPDPVAFGLLITAYLCIFGALYVDIRKVRKLRREYQAEMESKKSKELHAAQKQARAAAKKQTEEPVAAEVQAAESTSKPRGLFGSGFRLSKAEETRAQKKAQKEAAKEDKTAHDDTKSASK